MSTAAPTTTTPTVTAPRVTSRSARVLQVMAVALLLAVLGWVAIRVFVTDAIVPAQPVAGSQVDESAELERLARVGQLPDAAYDAEAEAIRRLTARGLIPTAPAATTITVSATTPVDEAAETARLVAKGLIPQSAQP